MLKKLFLIGAMLFLNCSSAFAYLKYPELSDSGFQVLQSGSSDLLRLCPSADCLIIFTGRSNVLISAYLEAQQNENLVSLPVSGIRDIPASAELMAKNRFSSEVLTSFLLPKMENIKNVIIVDFVTLNGGGSITRSAVWIQSFLANHHLPVDIKVAGYGGSINPKYSEILKNAGIKTEVINFGATGLPGTPAYLAKETQIENYAPYDEWNPVRTPSAPVFHPEERRYYPYYSHNNQREFTQYASYQDLVELFKKENPVQYIRLPAFDCKQGLTNFIN